MKMRGDLKPFPDALKMIVLYEDFATGQRAVRLCQSLVSELGSDFHFQTCFWKLDVLRVPKLTGVAADDAAEADVVLISAHGEGDLPVEFKHWLMHWPGLQHNPAKALVVLLDVKDENEGDQTQVQSFLQSFARKAQFDFFCQSYPTPAESGAYWNYSELAECDRSSVAPRSTAPHRAADRRRWGINE